MTVAVRVRQLHTQADDIAATLQIQKALRDLGFKTEVIEPENNPAFKGQNRQDLQRVGNWYEIVIGAMNNLVVQINVYPDHKLWPVFGVYRRWRRGRDNWANLIRQFASPYAVKWGTITELLDNLTPGSDSPRDLVGQLNTMNKTLRWIKTEPQQAAAHLTGVARVQDRLRVLADGYYRKPRMVSKSLLEKHGWTMNGDSELTNSKFPHATIVVGFDKRAPEDATYFVVKLAGKSPQRVATPEAALQLIGQPVI